MSTFLKELESKTYTTVPSTTIQASPVVKTDTFNSEEYKTNFTKASKDYWSRKSNVVYDSYNKGSFMGKYGKNKMTADEYFDKLFICIKESITYELAKKNITSEGLQENFNLLKISLKLLANAVEKDKLNVENLIAFLHGVVNLHIETFIKEREDNE